MLKWRWLSILLLVMANGVATAQKNDRSFRSILQEADQYYADEQYNLAIQLYHELTDQNFQDLRVEYNLAECYRLTFNYVDAEAYYLKVHFLAPEDYPLALYYYAEMLKFNGNFDESMTYFDEFIEKYQKNKKYSEYVEQAIIDKAGCESAKAELMSEKNTTKLEPLNLNSPYNDYAPAVKDSSNIAITSGRILSNRESIDERFGEAFTDNYYFEKINNTWHDKTKNVFSVTNTRYNDGSGCFNSNGDKYYFTVCGMDGPQCRIFVTSFKNGKWSEPVALNSNVNFRTTESKHPAISNGGDTLIFASNRNGGHGRFDLWMCIDSGDEAWGPAMNLGSSVNTKLNEVSPSFTAYRNVLFFASDGHPGHGGLDMFMAKSLSTSDTLLFNLDLPFNSNRDDCFISFSQRQLYWSSNRAKGTGGFDIYSVRIPSVLAFISRISLKKRDARRSIHLTSRTENNQQLNVSASRLEEKIDYDNLTYEKQQIVKQMVENRIQQNDDKPGNYIGITALEYEQLSAIANERYAEYVQRRNENTSLAVLPSRVGTPRDLMVTGFLADSVTGKSLPAQKILLMDDVGVIQKITVTNDEGKFRFTDVPSNQPLFIRMDKFSNTQHVTPVIRDLKITDSEAQQAVHFENVYFDFDHYKIRPEAKQVLDVLADQLMQHPEIQVEIFAYADDRGTSEYNLHLSQKRGQAVVDYLSQKGVDQTGLAIIAKGKQIAQETASSELQRQYDRRVELYVNGKMLQTESIKTYILKRKTDWNTLAQVTGISKDKLRAINGSTEDQLKAYQPVRIPSAAKNIDPEIFFVIR